MDDVFAALRETLSKEALLEAGEIGITKKRKRRRKIAKTDAAGQVLGEASADAGGDTDDGDDAIEAAIPDTSSVK